MLVTNCFSTQTSYENQTKKAITNKLHPGGDDGILQAAASQIYFIENKDAAEQIADQVLINKRSRENAEKTRQSIKTNLQQKTDMANRVQKFIDCRIEGHRPAARSTSSRATPRLGAMQAPPRRGVPGRHAGSRQDPQLPQGGLPAHLQNRHHHGPHEACWAAAWRSSDRRIKDLATFDLNNLQLEQGRHLHGC